MKKIFNSAGVQISAERVPSLHKALGLFPGTADENSGKAALPQGLPVTQMILNLDPTGKWTLMTAWVTSDLVSFNKGK